MKAIKGIMAAAALLIVDAHGGPSLLIGGGVNFSSMSDEDSIPIEKTMRAGYNAGLAFEQNFGRYFSFLTGFSFETRGQSEKRTIAYANGTEISDQDVNMRYCQIPLRAQFNMPVGPFRFSVCAGPEMGVFLSAKKQRTLQIQLPPAIITQSDTTDFSKDVNMLDFGVTAGASFEITAGPGAIFLQPGYYCGLTDFLDNKRATQSGADPAGRHTSIYARIGYKVNWGRAGSRACMRDH